jgi:hypothetical protein
MQRGPNLLMQVFDTQNTEVLSIAPNNHATMSALNAHSGCQHTHHA